MKRIFVNTMLCFFLLQSCGLLNSIFKPETPSVQLPDVSEAASKTEQLIQNAINTIQDESSNWQQILATLANDLTEATQSTLRTEVNNILTRAQATTGLEAKCFVDFMHTRLVQELQRLITIVRSGGNPPKPEPVFCSPVPASIDMKLSSERRNKIEFFGYDFDRYGQKGTNVNAFLVTLNNKETDITEHLSQQSYYLMTLNLGSNGLVLNEQSKKIRLKANNQIVAEMPVIQPIIQNCVFVERDLQALSEKLEIIPSKKGDGDKDFGGKVKITCKLTLSISFDKKGVNATYKMTAKEHETKFNDHSKAEGEKSTIIYRCPDGYTIDKILSEKKFEKTYTDEDWDTDIFNVGGDNPVVTLYSFGDHAGNDITDYTKAQFIMKKIRVKLKQSGNCR